MSTSLSENEKQLEVNARDRESPPEAVGNRLAKNALWSLFGTLGARAFSVLASVACARILGQANFGALGIIQNNVRAFAPISGRGLGTTATRFVARYRLSDPAKASRILSLTLFTGSFVILVTAIVFHSLSNYLALKVNRPDLVTEIRLSVLLFVAMSIFHLITEALAGFEGFRWIARGNQLEGFLLLVTIAFLSWQFGLIGAITAMIVSTSGAGLFLGWVLLAQAKAAGVNPFARFTWEEGAVLASYSLPNMLVLFTSLPAHWYAGILLAVQPDGAEQTALFNVAGQWRNVLLYLPAALIQASMPVLSQIRGDESKPRFERLVSLQVQLIWLMICGAGVGMMSFSALLLGIYGPEYRGAHSVIVFGAILAGMHSTSVFLNTAVASQAKMWFLWWTTLVSSVVLVIATYFLVPPFGASGFLVANILFFLSQGLMIVARLRSLQVLRAYLAPLVVYLGGAMVAWALVEWGGWFAYLLAPPLALLAMAACWYFAGRAMRDDLTQMVTSRLGDLRGRLARFRI